MIFSKVEKFLDDLHELAVLSYYDGPLETLYYHPTNKKYVVAYQYAYQYAYHEKYHYTCIIYPIKTYALYVMKRISDKELCDVSLAYHVNLLTENNSQRSVVVAESKDHIREEDGFYYTGCHSGENELTSFFKPYITNIIRSEKIKKYFE